MCGHNLVDVQKQGDFIFLNDRSGSRFSRGKRSANRVHVRRKELVSVSVTRSSVKVARAESVKSLPLL